MTRPPRQLIGHCGPRIIAFITSSSCDDLSDRVTTHHRRGDSTPTITIFHREARLCLVIRQVLIPIFEVPAYKVGNMRCRKKKKKKNPTQGDFEG
ncbi:hypothetical protein AVEN_102421-1 [Araneus ventricosus]|uniref:Uncharacterized protein n=1 Tax=Araneus ventricosus TaxID=182803 RepID=A0A4Y2A9V1_ARAVE|nr:hypothetical protein AVEN_102421-1 [Araneus ventricosus]